VTDKAALNIPAIMNATTAGGEAVRSITLDPGLQEKTTRVVIGDGQHGLEMRVIRASSSSRGEMSCEIYIRKGTGWSLLRKVRGPKLPPVFLAPPDGAMREDVDGVECFTMAPMSDEEKENLRRYIAPVTP